MSHRKIRYGKIGRQMDQRRFDRRKYRQSLIDMIVLNTITCPYHAIQMAYGSWDDKRVEHSLSEDDKAVYAKLVYAAAKRHEGRQKQAFHLAMLESDIRLKVLKAQNFINVYFRDIKSKYRIKIVWGGRRSDLVPGGTNLVFSDESDPFRLCMWHTHEPSAKYNKLNVEIHSRTIDYDDFDEMFPYDNTIVFSYMRSTHVYSFGKTGFNNMFPIPTDSFNHIVGSAGHEGT